MVGAGTEGMLQCVCERECRKWGSRTRWADESNERRAAVECHKLREHGKRLCDAIHQQVGRKRRDACTVNVATRRA